VGGGVPPADGQQGDRRRGQEEEAQSFHGTLPVPWDTGYFPSFGSSSHFSPKNPARTTFPG
jgi:hypothetical protein